MDNGLFRVSSSTNVNNLCGALFKAAIVRKEIMLKVVGAGSLNQAIKAVALCNIHLEAHKVALFICPAFSETETGHKSLELTVIYHDVYTV